MVPMLVNVTGRDITINGKLLPSMGEIEWVYGSNTELDSPKGYTVTLRDKSADKLVIKFPDGTKTQIFPAFTGSGVVYICLHKFSNVLKHKDFYYIVGDRTKATKIINCVI